MASPSTADMVLDSIDRVADGVKAGTNVTIKETGNGPIHKTVLTFDAMPVTLTDQASTVLYGGQKVYDFPDGLISILGCVADLDVAVAGNLNADADGDVGIGTVTASNNATLATTEQNICPTTAIPQLVASAGTSDCQNAAAIAPLDGTGTAVDVFLNYVWDDADHNGGSMTVTGTITIIWVQLGDN
jgi:hypothetical protein